MLIIKLLSKIKIKYNNIFIVIAILKAGVE